MRTRLFHRVLAVITILLVTLGPVTDVLAQRGGRGGAARGGGSRDAGSRSYTGSSVRQSRATAQTGRTREPSAQTSQARTSRPTSQTSERATQSGQGTRATQSSDEQRDIDTDQVGEATVIQGERGTAVVGEQGAIAAGEQGAVAVGENAAVGVGDEGAFAVNRETGQGAAVGEEGFAIADEGNVYGGEWDEGGVVWYEEDDWYVYDDVEAWQVAAGVAAGIAIGTMLASPPANYTTVYVSSAPYYFYDNVFYAPVMQGTTVVYQVIPPPVGAVISTLPAGCTTKSVNGVTHWICSGSAYIRVSSGYQVVAIPS